MRMLFVALAAAFIAAGVAVVAPAHEYRAGSLTIDHPVIFEGPPTQKAAAGYMTIRNEGAGADSLIDVRAEGPEASVHETREEGGVARMVPVAIVEIPAGGEVAFAPGGLHVMFMGVDGAALRAGATLDATLVFEGSGEVPVTFNVEPRPAGAGGAHATH